MSAAEIIPPAFIKDANFENVAQLFASQLTESTETTQIEHALKQLRNLFVISLELRRIAVEQGVHLRVVELLKNPNDFSSTNARSEALLILTCLYRSNLLTPDNFPLSSSDFLELIYTGIFQQSESTTDIKSRTACLLALLHHSCSQPSFLLSKTPDDRTWMEALLGLISHSENKMEGAVAFQATQQTEMCLILQIFSRGCGNEHVRDALLFEGVQTKLLSVLSALLTADHHLSQNVRICAVECLCSLCQRNFKNANLVLNSDLNFTPALKGLMGRDNSLSFQLVATKCLAVLLKASGSNDATSTNTKPRICENLVRLLRSDRPDAIRIEATTILTEFVDDCVQLQCITGMCDGLISVIATTLSNSSNKIEVPSNQGKEALDLDLNRRGTSQETHVDKSDDLTAPFLHLLSVLSSNDEILRRKVGDSPELVSAIMNGVRTHCNSCVQVAGLECLLSLSRSAYLLRTIFSDHQSGLSRDLLTIVKNEEVDVGVLAACLAVLCNLFLETALVKKAFLGSIESTRELIARIVTLSSHSNKDVRINSVWCLMNLTYQGLPSLKHQVYTCLSREALFSLLSDSKVPQIVTCTLGLLRNLMDGTPSEVDTGISQYGDQVVQSAVWILEGDYPVEIKEQVLRIIANMAAGEQSKETLLKNDDLLRKVMDYMLHSNLNVQIAAVDALSNLTLDPAADDYVGSLKRWQILESCGFIRVLNEMLTTTTEITLFVKVKRLIEVFSQHRFGICS